MTEHINALGQPIGFPVPDKLPRPFPPSTPMRGQHCSVVPLDADTQAEALYEAMRQDESSSGNPDRRRHRHRMP